MKIGLIIAASLFAVPAFAMENDMKPAAAIFYNADGAVVGAATLKQMNDGVHISGAVIGASEGEHGFHVHAVGLCDPAEGFSTAGDTSIPKRPITASTIQNRPIPMRAT